eukprot:SAG11_NODE_8871_length_968_cov_0.973533_1_plen_69_part_10
MPAGDQATALAIATDCGVHASILKLQRQLRGRHPPGDDDERKRRRQECAPASPAFTQDFRQMVCMNLVH